MNKAATLAAPLKEITLRGIIIGIILCVVFTAANVYFGLKAGLTSGPTMYPLAPWSFSFSWPWQLLPVLFRRVVRPASIL